MADQSDDIKTFALQKGRRLAGKYVVGDLIGRGWEGEVYHVTELGTGIERAAKLFFPARNRNNRVVTFHAKKLEKLRDCDILIRYHTRDAFRYRGTPITFLVSELVEGELLPEFIARQPGKRLQAFEALHLLHPLVVGLDEIHRQGDYHGDLHAENVLVRRTGLGFRVKLLDFYHRGRRTAEHVHDDLCDVIRLFYDVLGGAKHYTRQPAPVKRICCGLKRSLIHARFRTARHLRDHLKNLDWEA